MKAVRSAASRRCLAAAIIVFAAVTAGCGYTLAGRGSFLPAYVKTVGIPTFTNRSPVFNLETTLTEKVRSELIGRGKYTVLPQDNGVDAVITGEVTSVSITPVAFTQQNIASRYTITVVANIQLKDLHANKVIWENPSVIFRQEYENTSSENAVDVNAFFGHEANALDRVSSDFARSVVSSILEAF